MNRVYRLVFNVARGIIQVASEDASERSRGPVRGTRRSPKKPAHGQGMRLSPLAAAIAIVMSGSMAWAWMSPAYAASATIGKAGGTGGNGSTSAGGAGGTGTGTGAYANGGGSGGNPGSSGASGGPGGGGYGAGGSGGAGASVGGGGGGGGGGPGVSGSGSLANTGSITGGAGGAGGVGGTGLTGTTGYSSGGTGGTGGIGGIGGAGGAGVSGSGFTLTNSGTVTGGNGGNGGAGGTGGNGGGYTGAIGTGGNGGTGGTGGAGGAGGAGVSGSGFTLTNTGSITGGNGGSGGPGGAGGLGGPGIPPVGTPGATGSTGGSGSGGLGGAGVVATGRATITNAGTIQGGKADGGAGAQADAIDLSGGGNTLILEAGSKLVGNVVSAGGDTLELGGGTNATLQGQFVTAAPSSYSGTPVFYGFGTLMKTGASTWTITTPTTTQPNAIPNWNVQSGILKVNGNFTQSASDTLTIGITPLATTPGVDYGQLYVTGTASLAGALSVQPASGTYTVGTQYDVVHAGTAVSGHFSGVSYNPSFAAYITPQVSYAPKDVYLTLDPTPGVGGTAGPSFSTGEGTGISTWNMAETLFNDESAVFDAQNGTTGGPVASAHGKPDPAVWARGLRGVGDASGASLNNDTVLVGGGSEVRPGLIVGGAFSAITTGTQTDTQQVDTRTYGLYGYAVDHRGKLILDGAVSLGHIHTSSERSLPPTGLNASGSAPGWYTSAAVRAAWRLPRGTSYLMPYLSAGYLHLRRDAYTESGAGMLNLSYGAKTYDIGVLTAGVRAGWDWQTKEGSVVSPWVGFGLAAYTGNRDTGLQVALGTVQQTLPVNAAPANARVLDAGVTITKQSHWSAALAYTGQFANHARMNTGELKVVYRW